MQVIIKGMQNRNLDLPGLVGQDLQYMAVATH